MTDRQHRNITPSMPYKVGSFEVTVCVFKRGEFRLDDMLMAKASLGFDTTKELLEWADDAGVEFK
jgi:hypothetical protein